MKRLPGFVLEVGALCSPLMCFLLAGAHWGPLLSTKRWWLPLLWLWSAWPSFWSLGQHFPVAAWGNQWLLLPGEEGPGLAKKVALRMASRPVHLFPFSEEPQGNPPPTTRAASPIRWEGVPFQWVGLAMMECSHLHTMPTSLTSRKQGKVKTGKLTAGIELD